MSSVAVLLCATALYLRFSMCDVFYEMAICLMNCPGIS